MTLQATPFSESFNILQAKALKDNLNLEIFNDALQYLTGKGADSRGIKLSTLSKYNIGLGTEKFTDETGMYQGYDSIYFPMYAPKLPAGK